MSTTSTTRSAAPRALQGDEAQLFADYHAKLIRSVRWAVHGSDSLVEDACSHAWLTFLRCQPDRPTALAWLRTTAIHHAWDLSKQDRHAEYLDERPTADDAPEAPALDTSLEARRALGALAALPEPQRRCLALVIAGHSYTEVAAVTGRTRTNVNKQLRRARRNLHHA